MNYGRRFIRADIIRIVTINVSCCLTVLLAAFGFRYYYVSEDVLGGRLRASSPNKTEKNINKSKCDVIADEYRLYGAKTLYDEVREKIVEEVKIPGCIPKQFWLLSRHGARYPGPLEMHSLISRLPALKDNILENSKVGRGHLSTEEIDQLFKWDMKFSQDLDNHLTPWGEIEMKELGTCSTKNKLKN